MTPSRFIHTADWQLGFREHFIPGDVGAVVRDPRLKTVKKIGTIACEFEADFVIVASDVVEHRGIKPDTIRRSFDRMCDVPAQVLPLVNDDEQMHNAIPKDVAGRVKLADLALGDWHGRLRDAAKELQIIILTCHGTRFDRLQPDFRVDLDELRRNAVPAMI